MAGLPPRSRPSRYADAGKEQEGAMSKLPLKDIIALEEEGSKGAKEEEPKQGGSKP